MLSTPTEPLESTSNSCTDAQLTVLSPLDLAFVTGALQTAGCVAAGEEAQELTRAAPSDSALLSMLDRRLTGEPLAWITGTARFCGMDIAVVPGVYVPRWQSEPLALGAARLLPPSGLGVDLCTGTGAIAMVMKSWRPHAGVMATELDHVAAQCAQRNGVEVFEGDLDEPLPVELESQVDVMVGVLPYVPTDALHLLPRDVQSFEPRQALDGGEHGLELMAKVIGRSPRWIKPGGWLLLEVGGNQLPEVGTLLDKAGFGELAELRDQDGDPRGICARLDP
ncbi:MAG: N5-glutamine methyltransferase family protein [Acidimicrobiales bacterium]